MRFVCLILIVLSCNCVRFNEENGILILDQNNFTDAIKQYPYLVVHFWAPWSGHDKVLIKRMEIIAELFKDDEVKFARIESTGPIMMAMFEITGYPTVVVYKEGKSNYNYQFYEPNDIDHLKKFLANEITNISVSNENELYSLISSSSTNIVLFFKNSLINEDFIRRIEFYFKRPNSKEDEIQFILCESANKEMVKKYSNKYFLIKDTHERSKIYDLSFSYNFNYFHSKQFEEIYENIKYFFQNYENIVKLKIPSDLNSKILNIKFRKNFYKYNKETEKIVKKLINKYSDKFYIKVNINSEEPSDLNKDYDDYIAFSSYYNNHLDLKSYPNAIENRGNAFNFHVTIFEKNSFDYKSYFYKHKNFHYETIEKFVQDYLNGKLSEDFITEEDDYEEFLSKRIFKVTSKNVDKILDAYRDNLFLVFYYEGIDYKQGEIYDKIVKLSKELDYLKIGFLNLTLNIPNKNLLLTKIKYKAFLTGNNWKPQIIFNYLSTFEDKYPEEFRILFE